MKRLFDCPVVLTIHDLYAYDDPKTIGFPNVYLNRLVIRSSIAASAEVVSISRFTRDRLIKWFPRLGSQMALPVIYQSVSVSKPEAPAQPVQGYFLLCVAQHRIHKNLDLVIEGYQLAIQTGLCSKDTKLVVVGSEGPETSRLRALAENFPGVLFLNSISDAHLAYLYSSCELYICASSIEGFCLPLVEAMLSCCRNVCSDIPILREVAGDDATYFPLEGKKPEALLNAMRIALTKERRPAASPALKEQVGERWAEVYGRVATTFQFNRGAPAQRDGSH